ncbi:Isochorismatase hydrolase [Cystobasidium minutum MCA 4210]|uniref:Isochorismatase hydrolase n=1 Tax=Cystobasidium minutum MCA 4210 TaxID=1397322 RepID=UPI0034CE502A|eukprot:jgi/Rhomi1/165216/fgenesh1_kg.1_\
MAAAVATSFSRKIHPSKTAFLVCDIQERFRNAIYGFEAMVLASTKMVKAASILEIPVFATEQNPKALGKTVEELGLQNLPKELHPLGEALPKTLFSMMIPEITEAITKRGIASVVIFGIESHVCVLQTALDCLDLGLDVHIVADGVSSCNKQEIPIALERIRQAGGKITTTESVLFQLMVDSSHPQFRTISKLVKEEKENTVTSLSTLTSHL